LFSDVRVSRVGDRVVITVTENNVINRVAFEGNSAVKTETLTTEVQSKSRGPYSKAMVDADIERIKDVIAVPAVRQPRSLPGRSICQTASSMSSSPSTKAERPALRQSISSATRSILPASSVNSWRRRR